MGRGQGDLKDLFLRLELCSYKKCQLIISDPQIFSCRAYQWIDDRGKKSRVSAPQYIDYIMTYVQKTINDESIFPTKQES